MPSLSSIVFFGTIGLALTALVVLWKHPLLGLLVAIPIMLLGWAVIVPVSNADIDADVAQVHAPQARGERLTMEDAMYDGVGDRVGVLFCGWLPGALGIGLGSGVAYAIRHSRRRAAGLLPTGTSETDIWFTCPLGLEEIAVKLGLSNVSLGSDGHWTWAMGDLEGVSLDIVRTHTQPPGTTETSVFRVDNQPLSSPQKARLLTSIRGLVSGPIMCGRRVHRTANEVAYFASPPTPPAPLPRAPLPPE